MGICRHPYLYLCRQILPSCLNPQVGLLTILVRSPATGVVRELQSRMLARRYPILLSVNGNLPSSPPWLMCIVVPQPCVYHLTVMLVGGLGGVVSLAEQVGASFRASPQFSLRPCCM